MEELLQRLDRALAKTRPEYYAGLQPGLSSEEMSALEQQLGGTLPDDFKQFLQWRNGQSPGNNESFWAGRTLMSSAEILDTWGMWTGMQEDEELDDPNSWNRAWIPFTDNCGGDNVVVDMEGSFGGIPGQLLEFWHDWDQRDIVFESFSKFIETMVVALENGYTAEDDNEIFKEAYQRLNPGYPIKNKTAR